MSGEQLVTEAVRERRRGGAMIWAEWHFGETLLFLSRDGQDFLEYYGVEFSKPADLEQWSYYMNGDLDSESDEFVQWSQTHIWHEFETWDEAERWFEGDDEDSLHLRRGEQPSGHLRPHPQVREGVRDHDPGVGDQQS